MRSIFMAVLFLAAAPTIAKPPEKALSEKDIILFVAKADKIKEQARIETKKLPPSQWTEALWQAENEMQKTLSTLIGKTYRFKITVLEIKDVGKKVKDIHLFAHALKEGPWGLAGQERLLVLPRPAMSEEEKKALMAEQYYAARITQSVLSRLEFRVHDKDKIGNIRIGSSIVVTGKIVSATVHGSGVRGPSVPTKVILLAVDSESP